MPNHVEAARLISEHCLCQRTRQMSRALTRLYDSALRPLGLQNSQLTLLVAVARFGEGGAGMGALADAILMDRTTLTRNIKPLERAGLLRVARSPTDARARVLFLTRSGERLLEAALPLWQQAQTELKTLLGQRRTKELYQQLERDLELVAARHVS